MVDIDDKDSSDVDTILEEYSLKVVVADMEVVWIDVVAVVVVFVVVVDVVIKPLRGRDIKSNLQCIFKNFILTLCIWKKCLNH